MKGKRLVFKVILPAVCCLCCALITWICVMGVSNPMREVTITDIHVASCVEAESGIGYDAVAEGSVTLKGPHSAVASVLTDGFCVLLPFDADCPGGVYSVAFGDLGYNLPSGVTAECDELIVTVTPRQ